MADDLLRLTGAPTPGEIAGRNTDPRFFAMLAMLPNPDPILRRAGKSEDVFDAIQSDAHVIGELRSIKTDLQRFKHRLVPGGPSRADKRAFELCQAILDRQPAAYTTWLDVIWNISQSVFRGMSIHEIVWEKSGDVIVPAELLDRPKRRFSFNGQGELRVLTREQPLFGIPAEQLYFLVDRHMPSYDNPYGVALFSSCYWPYVFKHGGFRWFVKFCERFGIPFPVGKYAVGSQKEVIDALEKALENLIEAGYAALEDGGSIEILETKVSGGKLAQHQLIETCNAEMSKALTSQTLATEQTGGNGSRAASQTHHDRAAGVNEGTRESNTKTLNELWSLITRINFGPGVNPPKSMFPGDSDATLDRANVYKVFIDSDGRPSRKAMAEELGITLADPSDPADAMQAPKPAVNAIAGTDSGSAQFSAFSTASAIAEAFPDQAALDAALDALDQQDATPQLLPLLQPLLKLARRDPTAVLGQLADAYPNMDADALTDWLMRLLFVADTWGRLSAQKEVADAASA